VDASPDGRFTVDAQLRVQRVTMNPDVTWLVDADDVLGRRLADAFPPWLAEVFGHAVALTFAYRRAVPFSYEWVAHGIAHARIGWARARRAAPFADIDVSVLGTRHVTEDDTL
jgi:hypothetical protein